MYIWQRKEIIIQYPAYNLVFQEYVDDHVQFRAETIDAEDVQRVRLKRMNLDHFGWHHPLQFEGYFGKVHLRWLGEL